MGVPPEQQSQLCEKKELSLEQLAFLKQKYDEAQYNLNQSKECHESSNEKDIHTLCRKLLADLKHIQEERKTMEIEAQRKHEEEEIHKELEHFLYNAFNLFEEEQQESEHTPKSFTKPIFSHVRPNDGVFRLTNEKKPDNELIFSSVNKVSHDAFGEDATAFKFIHVPHLFVGGSIECSMSNNKIELTSLPDSELCGKPGEAQQVNNQQLNKLITDAGRKQWDPGILNTMIDVPPVVKWSSLEVLLPCSMLDAANSIQQGRNVALVLHFWRSIFNDIQYCQICHKCNAMRSQLYWHQDIKLNGIALWLITFKPP